MSDFFDSGDTEKMPPPPIKAIRQKNTIIGILIAIIGVLVAILLVKGFDGSDNAVPSVQTVEETGSVTQPIETSPTTTEDIAEEPEPAPEEEEVPEPTPLPDDPESLILLADYVWMDPTTSGATIALQELLELEADGWYGLGTRAAHLVELEARGLPVSSVPTCDVVVGSDLCLLEGDEPMEQAVEVITAGFGEPTSQQGDWLLVCGAEHKKIEWGPVVAYFRKMTMKDGVFVDEPSFVSWNIENSWNGDSDSWVLKFPTTITFPESSYVQPNENGDFSEPQFITDIVIPNGEYVTSSIESLEETFRGIDPSIAFSEYFPYDIQFVKTSEYVIGAETTPQGVKWIWGTAFWSCE
jgi:hypothetical protein